MKLEDLRNSVDLRVLIHFDLLYGNKQHLYNFLKRMQELYDWKEEAMLISDLPIYFEEGRLIVAINSEGTTASYCYRDFYKEKRKDDYENYIDLYIDDLGELHERAFKIDNCIDGIIVNLNKIIEKK